MGGISQVNDSRNESAVPVDLDALERIVERAKAEDFGSLAFSMDTKVIAALIRRVREAEADLPRLRFVYAENQRYKAGWDALHVASNKAIDELEGRLGVRTAQLVRVLVFARHGDLCASEMRNVPCDCGYSATVASLGDG